MGAEQMAILRLENKPFQEKSNLTTLTAQSPQSQNEMDLTETINKNILSVDRTRSMSKKDNPSQESHGETSTTYNILRETTNLDPNQRQSRTVVKRPVTTQEKALQASMLHPIEKSRRNLWFHTVQENWGFWAASDDTKSIQTT